MIIIYSIANGGFHRYVSLPGCFIMAFPLNASTDLQWFLQPSHGWAPFVSPWLSIDCIGDWSKAMEP